MGVGTMGHVHTDAYKQMPDVEIVGVYDISPERAADFVKAKSLPKAFPTFAALRDAVDFVDVCTPTPTHIDYVLDALHAGKDVVTEKPMARNLADCERMIAAAKETGRTLMPAQVLRFFPEYSSANALVRQGTVGTPATVRTRRGGGFPRATNDWYADFAQSGGVTLDTIIHDFDWLLWTFGPIEHVFANVAMVHDPSLDHLDYSLVTLKFQSGLVGHVEGTWAEPGSFSVACEVAGDEGLIEFDSANAVPLRLSLRRQDGQSAGVAVPESPTSVNPYYLELRHFVDCLKAGAKPSITPEDGLAAVAVALAAIESARSGKAVPVGAAKA